MSNSPSKTVVITGAAGFIGSHLVEQCLGRGWRVTAIDSFTEYYSERIKRQNVADLADHPGCRLIEGDLMELELGPIVDEAEIVFHLAGQPGVRASWDAFSLYARENLNATQRLLQAAVDASVARFVLASSSSIYGDAATLPTSETVEPRPVSPYGVTKVAAEHLANVYWRTFGVPTVCVRYFTVYGPRQRPDMAFNQLIEAALTGKEFRVFGDGRQTRDFTYVGDAVAGTLAAAERGASGCTYNIGGGSRRSMNDVFETLGALMGARIELQRVDGQAGDARDTAADISAAIRELGYLPATDFEVGLKAQLDWQRAALASAPAH